MVEEPFVTANPLNCSKCCIACTLEEKQEWDKAVKDKKAEFLDLFGQEHTPGTQVCRKCIARIDILQKFKEHFADDEYWRDGKYSEEWEWWAWRITEDFEDSAILQRDLRQMMEEKLTVEDYNKIIDVLAMMMLSYKYTKDASMGDSR